MRLLMDTHVFLWVVSDSARLGGEVRRQIAAAEQTFVSAASTGEVAVKARLGRIDADVDAVAAAIERSGFFELPVRAAEVSQLPLRHADPVDRLLVTHALAEPLRLLTADAALRQRGDIVHSVERAGDRRITARRADADGRSVGDAAGADGKGRGRSRGALGDYPTRRVHRARIERQPGRPSTSTERPSITVDPGRRGGRPGARDLRIGVGDVPGGLAAGMTPVQVRSDCPELTQADIGACVAFAAGRESREVRSVAAA